MQAIFFHNRHDRASNEQLAALSEGVRVIDYYGGDPVPSGYKVIRMPYLIDKELVFVVPEPLSPGELTLTWECRDAEGNLVDDSEALFFITVNGETHSDTAENGLVQIIVEAPEPMTLAVEIINDLNGYHPWRGTLEVMADG